MPMLFSDITKWTIARVARRATLVVAFLFVCNLQNIEARKIGKVRRAVRELSKVDTNYIEPQHYNFTVMMQTTYTYDKYSVTSANGQEFTMAPDVSAKIGPYVGWRWFFLGYTFDLKHLSPFNKSKKQEVEFSIYSSKIGVDLFYRRTGSDYKIRDVFLGENIDGTPLQNVPFDGINVGITGANIYYIFNHRKFSYPAAFAQSTCQKRSCGSWMVGLGFLNNSISIDHEKLQNVVNSTLKKEVPIDSGLMINNLKYYDINATIGYGYNWVFAKNWLLSASASAAIAYKHSQGETEKSQSFSGLNFNFNDINLDGIFRLGVVYNNTKWYAGMSGIMHSYHYRKPQFETNNTFGNVNLYVGYNFGLKKSYRNKHK